MGRSVTVTAALAAVLVAACGSGSDIEEVTATEPTAADTTDTDMSASADMAGSWLAARDTTFVFREDGTYDAGSPGTQYEYGTFEVDGHTLTLDPDEGSLHCGEQTGRYDLEFTDDGDAVTFVKVEDPCRERATTMTMAPADRVEDAG